MIEDKKNDIKNYLAHDITNLDDKPDHQIQNHHSQIPPPSPTPNFNETTMRWFNRKKKDYLECFSY